MVAPAARMEIAPLYVPAESPDVFTLTVMVEGAVPLADDTESQAASLDAVQAIVPPPLLDTLSVLPAGLDPP